MNRDRAEYQKCKYLEKNVKNKMMNKQNTINELHDLKGKVALITGGARHLGFDAADVLAEAGCDLVITSRKLENAKAAAGQLEDRHKINVLPLALDVCVYDMVAEAISVASEWKGHLDILVNNAGGGVGSGPTHLFDRKPE